MSNQHCSLEKMTFYFSVAYNEVAALNKQQNVIECVELFRPNEHITIQV